MKKLALQYYAQGYNCSQCILKAAEKKYSLPISKQCFNMCSGINTGFGIGDMCSVLIAGIMIFGLLFDNATTKRLRMELLENFEKKHSCLSCKSLKSKLKNGENCETLVSDIAQLIEELIDKEF